MKIQHLILALLLALGINGFTGFSADIPERPHPPRLVNDFAQLLSPREAHALEQMLVAMDDTTSTQITMVTLPSLNGYDIASMAVEIGHRWGVGQKGFDNGVVILVKPKTSRSRGQAYIATGYGVEEFVPDALAKRIVENEMIPAFKQNDYFTGLAKASQTVMALVSGQFTTQEYQKKTRSRSPFAGLIPFVAMGFIFFLMRAGRSRHYQTGRGLPFWTAMMMMGSVNRGHSGSWNDFSSGSGGFGGGGGFGGFGGGGFGGGGAGGSW